LDAAAAAVVGVAGGETEAVGGVAGVETVVETPEGGARMA